MNLRNSKLAEEIIDGLLILDVPEGSLLLVNLPPGLDNLTTRNIGEAITSALKALGKNNPILLMPKDIKISALTELDMKEIGWVPDVRTTTGNITDSRLQRATSSDPIARVVVQEHKIRSEITNNYTEVNRNGSRWETVFSGRRTDLT